MSELHRLTKQEARAAFVEAAWTENGPDYDPCPNCNWRAKEPRTLIHCFAGSIGADWDLVDALDAADKAADIFWVWSMFDHDLALEDSNGRVWCFQARAPQPIRDAILAAAREPARVAGTDQNPANQ